VIINTGQRTDIPAFYSKWFCNRLKEGIVCVRNPFNPVQVSRYRLNPDVVDVIGFCTKNPAPMLDHMDLLSDYGQYWFVTITPYGRDIEPNVPEWQKVVLDFQKLSRVVGIHSTGWRYDPIFLSDRYTHDYHIRFFSKIAEELEGYTETAVISFLDIYQKVTRNFPQGRQVPMSEKISLGAEMTEIARKHGMTLKPCAEGNFLAQYGADCSGCMTVETYEKAIGSRLQVPNKKPNRESCACYLACDIGAYDTCMHLCRYCYANSSPEQVRINIALHNPDSPFLIGNYRKEDMVHDVKQSSWIDNQLSLF